MEQGLDSRIKKFEEEYLIKVKDNETPDLDKRGKISLMSMIYDLGYEQLEDYVYFKKKSNNSIEVFVYHDIFNREDGFSYINIDDTSKYLDILEKIPERLNDKIKPKSYFKNGCYIGGGFTGILETLLVAREKFEMSEFSIPSLIIVPVVSALIIGGIGYLIGNLKYSSQEKKSKDFMKNYHNNITFGKQAICDALGYEAKKN